MRRGGQGSHYVKCVTPPRTDHSIAAVLLSHDQLQRTFGAADQVIRGLEDPPDPDSICLEEQIRKSIECVALLVRAYIEDEGRKPCPPREADLLDAFKVLVKGDPTWNAIRDNCRELVYYRNCIQLDRRDALPAQASRMAARIARHVYLYMSTRCQREGRLQQ
jgi:hypothetical protein